MGKMSKKAPYEVMLKIKLRSTGVGKNTLNWRIGKSEF